MLDEIAISEINKFKRITSVIVLALCAGVITFAVITMLIAERPNPPELGVLTLVCLGFAGVAAVLSLIVPRALVAASRKGIVAGTWTHPAEGGLNPATDAGKLAMIYQTSTIVACGILDAAAFSALVAFLLEGHFAAMAVAGVIVIGISLHMPLGDRMTTWVENQLRVIEDEKQLRPTR